MPLVIPSAKTYKYCSRPVEGIVRKSIRGENRSDQARTAYIDLVIHASDGTLRSNYLATELKLAFSYKSEASLQEYRT